MTEDLQAAVARSADRADLHATVPTLLIEVQTALGALAATVTTGTERGRRPYRPDANWAARLGELAYGVYLLADQTGVDIADAVTVTARQVEVRREQTHNPADDSWPFQTR